MTGFLVNLLSAALLPPFNLLLLGTGGLMLLKSRPRLGKLIIIIPLACFTCSPRLSSQAD